MLNIKALFSKIEVRQLLWTNPDPTSEFTAKTVNLDLSNYDSVQIVYKGFRTYGESYTAKSDVGSSGCRMGCHINTSGSAYPMVLERAYDVTISGVQFYAGSGKSTNSTSTSTQNGCCVPYKIYGIRKLGGVVNKLLRAISNLTRKEVVVC